MPDIASLKGDRAFQRLRRGRPGGSRLLSIRWRPTDRKRVDVGIVVSKRVGKAVTRNRVRRRLREALLSLLSEAESKGKGGRSFELVVIARPEAAQASYADLKDALRKSLERGKAL